VTAFSVDSEGTTIGSIAKHKLRFPIGHGADADKISAATGAYTNDKRHYPQATGFLLAPDGSILNAVYSQSANRPSGS
jgi:hypothetical protein